MNDTPPTIYTLTSYLEEEKKQHVTKKERRFEKSRKCLSSYMYSLSIVQGTFKLITVIISVLLPISMIIIGVLNKDNCPIDSRLPLWITIMGSSWLCFAFLMLLKKFLLCTCSEIIEETIGLKLFRWITYLIALFLLVWFFLGNLLIYKLNGKSFHENVLLPDSQCNQTLYLFSFWSITAIWTFAAIVAFIFLLIPSVLFLCSCC